MAIVSPRRDRKDKQRRIYKTSEQANDTASIGYWLLGFALLLALFSYWPTLKYEFVFDDVQQIVENPAIRSWNNLTQYFTAHVWAGVFPGSNGNYYRPLFLLWLRLNYVLFKLAPWGWHFTSLLAHLSVICIVFLLVRQSTSDILVAGWATLLFAVHPIHIEAVAWISAVPEMLLALASLGSLYGYLRFRREQSSTFLRFTVVLYLAALLVKETAIVIWPMIFACDWRLLRDARSERSSRARVALVKGQLPFAIVTAVYIAMRLYALRGLAEPGTHSIEDVLRTAPSLAWFYMQKLIAPFGLSAIYFNPETWSFHSFLQLIGICGVVIGLFLWGRKSKAAAFGGLLLALPLVPPLLGVSVFPPHDLAHNRYLYLPSAGACILLALALRAATHGGRHPATISGYWLGSVIVAATALGLVVAVRAQEQQYRDNVALFSRAAEISPDSAMAWGFLGEALMTTGRYPEGIAAFRREHSLEPDTQVSNYRLGAAYYLVQDMAAAELFFQRAVETRGNQDVASYDYALYRLALSQYAQGKMPLAEATLRQAVALQPRGLGYHLALAAALKSQEKLLEARNQLEQELKLGADPETSKLLTEVNAELNAKGPR